MVNETILQAPFKASLLYYILEEFQNYTNEKGNFQYVDRNDIFKSLVEREIIEPDKEKYFHRAVTALSTYIYHQSPNVSGEACKLLNHDNGPMNRITDLGYLVYLTWEKEYGEDIEFEINEDDPDIKIKGPCKIFVSCGSRDREKPLGDFLFDKIKTENVTVYWWGKKNPSQAERMAAWKRFREEIKGCDYFVAMLHRRERLGFQRYHSSNAVKDEIKWAIEFKKHMSIFKEKDVVIDGMILREEIYRPVSNSAELLRILQDDISKWQG